MSIARASRIRNEMCYIQICIDTYDDGEIRGRLFNAYYREAIFFDSSMDMIRILEEIFNTFDYPHATMDLRTLDDGSGLPGSKAASNGPRVVTVDSDEGMPQLRTMNRTAVGAPGRVRVAPSMQLYTHTVRGKLATMRMRVMFRQNASWQGTLKWVEEDLQEDFGSVLDLMLLLDSIFE